MFFLLPFCVSNKPVLDGLEQSLISFFSKSDISKYGDLLCLVCHNPLPWQCKTDYSKYRNKPEKNVEIALKRVKLLPCYAACITLLTQLFYFR